MMNTEFKLSLKETIYMSIIWLLRHIFTSKYHNFKKTKYDIDTYEDYLLAEKISSMAGKCNNRYPKVEKYKIENFSDISNLMNEVVRYEYARKMYWMTSNDRCAIEGWRDHVKYGNDDGILGRIHLQIVIEFLR